MKSVLLGLLSLLPFSTLLAQDFITPSKESQAYHEARYKKSIPPYGLAKVKELIAKINPDSEEAEALGTKEYLSLSLREKFTYHMIHAETYAQNCDVIPPIEEEHKKIFARIPSSFNDYQWSRRQTDFFAENIDSVCALIRESALRSNRIGCNYKSAIIEMNAVQMIPFLADFFKKDKKDLDILTVFLQLMEQNKYAPFMQSSSWKKLYSENASYEAYLDYNTANEALILQRVNDFYKNYKK
ncbi:hypothetical protein SAMN05444266_103414 [Chitinophaga jiangningensis]|uniref:Uncharacterized protein n=1 Tax=Chitinophaga jiangningensis TaxID=1419482 RepID=A0A1M7AUG5_9BACT|nr:hypothetical protein [Chitinophaga jiangningensis]SHL46345.1 hypothetical protein SAMN05444266_103414 [Chitinophaga jiangningensis]